MTKSINVSDAAYDYLLNKASNQSIKEGKPISFADVVDEMIKKEGV